MSMEREVSGLRCSEVLLGLTDFLEGTLPSGEIGRIQAHLAGCDACARFGERFAQSIALLREQRNAASLPTAVAQRLDAALRAAGR